MIAFVAALVWIEFAAVAVGAGQRAPGYLRGLALIQMVLIALFAPKLFEVGGFTSNVGSIFYATVFACQCATVRRFGLDAATKNIRYIAALMVVFYALAGIVGTMPMTAEDAAFAAAVDQIAATSPLDASASLVAFVAGQVVLVGILHKFPGWRGTALGVAAAQAVDSALFYPAVFHAMPMRDLTQIAVDGYAAKLACAAVLVPAYVFYARRSDAA